MGAHQRGKRDRLIRASVAGSIPGPSLRRSVSGNGCDQWLITKAVDLCWAGIWLILAVRLTWWPGAWIEGADWARGDDADDRVAPSIWSRNTPSNRSSISSWLRAMPQMNT